jgi:hypothetical protein
MRQAVHAEVRTFLSKRVGNDKLANVLLAKVVDAIDPNVRNYRYRAFQIANEYARDYCQAASVMEREILSCLKADLHTVPPYDWAHLLDGIAESNGSPAKLAKHLETRYNATFGTDYPAWSQPQINWGKIATVLLKGRAAA